MCHMKTVSLRELHEETGAWVRKTERVGVITITDRGKAIALITPIGQGPTENPFHRRVLRPGYAKLRGTLTGGTDSTAIISEDRNKP